jgi:hypothetical protein
VAVGAVGVGAVSYFLPDWAGLAVQILVAALLLGIAGAGAKTLFGRAVFLLGENDQLRVEGFRGRTVHRGPGMKVLNPLGYRSAATEKALTLGPLDYVKVRSLQGQSRIVKGPQLFFRPAEERQIGSVGKAVSLVNGEYVRVHDRSTGTRTVVVGPQVFVSGPHDDVSAKRAATSLVATEYLVVKDKLSGTERVVKGPAVFVPEPYDEIVKSEKAITLQKDEYVRITDKKTGQKWCAKGPAKVLLEPSWISEGIKKAVMLKNTEYVRLVDDQGRVAVHRGDETREPVFPGPRDELLDGKKLPAVELKFQEYVKVLDKTTGTIRTVRGPASVFLGAHERFLGAGKRDSVEVDVEHAVVVRDKNTGQLRMVTEPQLFFPGPDEVIEDVRQKINLADHECVIVKDHTGTYTYHYGNDAKATQAGTPGSFFLPPHAQVVELVWSRGPRRDQRDLRIQRLDLRAQYMLFEFSCRTADNVELVLEGTFFWQIGDVPTMLATTGDVPGDVCSHARSQFIRYVSRVSLKEFMEELHELARKVYADDNEFYSKRGLQIHSLEITSFHCADPSTRAILEQIIQETTNRMNRLSQAESEAEVKHFRTKGQIDQQQLNTNLLRIQHDHQKQQAKVQGKAEADKAVEFLQGLEKSVPNLADRLRMWTQLRQGDCLGSVADGHGKVFFTPNDMNLSIEAA